MRLDLCAPQLSSPAIETPPASLVTPEKATEDAHDRGNHVPYVLLQSGVMTIG